ncbi:hypothetical protein ACYZUC_05600 [Pseudomonas sp. GT1P32]
MSNKPDFFEATSGIEIMSNFNPDYNYVRYPFDYRTEKMVLSGASEISIVIPAEQAGAACLISRKRHDGGYGNGQTHISVYGEASDKPEIISSAFETNTLSSLIDILYIPDDMTRFASYIFDGVDHGDKILQLNYSKFYPLNVSFLDDEVSERLAFSELKRISYPQNSPYDVDVVINGELVENVGGKSLADGVDALEAEGVYVRVRYRSVDYPYYGSLKVTFILKQGATLAPSMEVVKPI